MNRCRSVYPLLLVTSGMTLADLHTRIDLTLFEMYMHGCSMRQARLSPINLHLWNLHVQYRHSTITVSGAIGTYVA